MVIWLTTTRLSVAKELNVSKKKPKVMTNKQTKLLFTLIDFIDFTTTSRKRPLCRATRVVAYERVKYNLL